MLLSSSISPTNYKKGCQIFKHFPVDPLIVYLIFFNLIRLPNMLSFISVLEVLCLYISILSVSKLVYLVLCLPLQTSNHLLGPKPFPLDRLLAIFYSVVDSRVAPTASIFSQVALFPQPDSAFQLICFAFHLFCLVPPAVFIPPL